MFKRIARSITNCLLLFSLILIITSSAITTSNTQVLAQGQVNTCNLYPIALSEQTLVGVAVGTVIPDILNGMQPGNFGWLTWAGSPSEPTLVKSLTPPGDSNTYINVDNLADHVVSVGD